MRTRPFAGQLLACIVFLTIVNSSVIPLPNYPTDSPSASLEYGVQVKRGFNDRGNGDAGAVLGLPNRSSATGMGVEGFTSDMTNSGTTPASTSTGTPLHANNSSNSTVAITSAKSSGKWIREGLYSNLIIFLVAFLSTCVYIYLF